MTWREIHSAVGFARHAKRHPKSSSVAHNDKTIQNLECDRRQDKEVDRRDAVDVIAEKTSASPETVAASGGTCTEATVDWATSKPTLEQHSP